MKIRSGFVSNSSTSSFIICTKSKLSKDLLIEKMNIGKKSLLKSIAIDIAKSIMSGIEETVNYPMHETLSVQEFIEDRYGIAYDELAKESKKNRELEIIAKALKKDFIIYFGSATDENRMDDGSVALCNMDIDYADDDFMMYKKGGY